VWPAPGAAAPRAQLEWNLAVLRRRLAGENAL